MTKQDEKYLTLGIKANADNLHVHFRNYIDKLVLNKDLKPGDTKATKEILAAMRYFSRFDSANFELWYIPKKYITKEIVWAAPFGNGADLEYIPRKFKSENLYLYALKKDPTGCLFEYMERKYWSEKLLEVALKINGMYLDLIPKPKRSYKLCTIAVKSNGLALKFVPNKLKDEKITVIALKQNPNAVAYQKNARSIFTKLIDEKIKSLPDSERAVMRRLMVDAINLKMK